MFLFNEPLHTCHECHQGAAAHIIMGAQEGSDAGPGEGNEGTATPPGGASWGPESGKTRPRSAIVTLADAGTGTRSPGSAAATRLQVSAPHSKLATMPWTGVVKWMRDLDIDEEVIQVIQRCHPAY